MTEKKLTPVCCKLGCRNDAEYEIWVSPRATPDDYTHACSEHVGDLLTDAEQHTVYRIDALEAAQRQDTDHCPPGCQGIDLGNGEFSGCSCGTGVLANGQPTPPGFRCDCPNHPR